VGSAELTATQDISLVVAGDDVNVLHAAGIRTAGQLADADPAVIAALPLTGSNAATARVRARAWLAGLPLVRKVEQVHVPRADLELDVDMESFLEDGAYLWGTYLSGPAVQRLGLTSGYRGFVTWRPLPDQDEGRAFAEFWAYLAGLRTLTANHGLTFAAYCYSRSAEERWLRSTPLRYPQVAGMPTPAEIAAFCSSPEWVDIYQEIKDQFVVPGSMKLKVLAPVAGFGWRDPDPGGENSMAWYRDAVGPADRPGQRGPHFALQRRRCAGDAGTASLVDRQSRRGSVGRRPRRRLRGRPWSTPSWARPGSMCPASVWAA
jgi:predicted RecB family nuclease